jgi:hypothetical protein
VSQFGVGVASRAAPVRLGSPDLLRTATLPEFLLTAHPAGYWCKKIGGRLHYFDRWSDPNDALQAYLDQKEALHADRKARLETEGLTVKQLCHEFLNAK